MPTVMRAEQPAAAPRPPVPSATPRPSVPSSAAPSAAGHRPAPRPRVHVPHLTAADWVAASAMTLLVIAVLIGLALQ